jgi:hypothetical protein
LAVSFLTFLSLVVSVPSWGDIYKWTDEQGNAVISNIPPPKRATKIELIAEETRQVAQVPVTVSRPAEQMLLDRIEKLERQVRTQPNPSEGQRAVAAPGYSMQAPLPPPPPNYFPIDYANNYYPWAVPYSYAVFPARTFVSRPTFPHAQNRAFHGGGVQRGRR